GRRRPGGLPRGPVAGDRQRRDRRGARARPAARHRHPARRGRRSLAPRAASQGGAHHRLRPRRANRVARLPARGAGASEGCMRVYVFLGPSLPVQQARRYLDATYLPPVQQGDVLRLLAERPDVIRIVDGYFDTVPSVWHKEILVALSSGVHVFGAASMGALRAAELHRYGMVGVGEVFEWYRSGRLEDDDEVAIAHEPAEAGFRQASVAMVDVRDACRAAVAAGVISAALAERVTAIARRAGDDAALDGLERFLAAYGPPLKQRDAVALLERIAAFVADRPAPLRVPYRVEQTVFLDSLQQEIEQAHATRLEAQAVDPDQALRIGETLPA